MELHPFSVGKFRIQFKTYRREFKTPFRSSQGILTHREGILIRLEDDSGAVGFGEVAPMEIFCTESLNGALLILEELSGNDNGCEHGSLPHGYPATEVALWTAERMARGPDQSRESYEVAALLPAGEGALERIEQKLEEGFSTFKWKVGIHPVQRELKLLARLVEIIPPHGKLRLDANGGLSHDSFRTWLENLESMPHIDFFEQPLPPGEEGRMLEMARPFGVRVALDESICRNDTLRKLSTAQWDAVPVVKPSIAGNPEQYLEWRIAWDRAVVYSSAFETAIGMENALRTAASATPREEKMLPLGFGTNSFFVEDGFSLHGTGPEITVGEVDPQAMEAIWNSL